MGMVLLLLFYLPFPLCGLIPGWVWGPVSPGESRQWAAWGTAVALNILAAHFMLGYMAFLLAPLVGFGIAAAVGSVAGRKAWLYGSLASFWFIIPFHIHWFLTASPGQISAYGIVPPDLIILALPGGVLGGLAASGILRFRPARNRPPDAVELP